MPDKPTMQDVADRAGVSRSLVSLVFQGADNVSDARRALVLDTARALGYRPNRVARHLAQGRSMTIGVVIDDLQNPFFARAVEGIEQRLADTGYQVLLANGGRDAERTHTAASTFVDLLVDGVILVGVRGDKAPFVELARDRPIVFVSDHVEADEVDSVSIDEALGCRLAVEHLVALGHERIVHVDGGQGASAEQRRRGYRATMKRVGLADHIDIIGAEFTHEAGARAARALLERAPLPTAVFAANDLIATGLWAQLQRMGLGVPADVSIVGFDDSVSFGLAESSLTTIRQPSSRIGARAGELMLQRLESARTDPVVEHIAPTLVRRSSTAAPAGV